MSETLPLHFEGVKLRQEENWHWHFSKCLSEALFTRTPLIQPADGIVPNCSLNVKDGPGRDSIFLLTWTWWFRNLGFMLMPLKMSRKLLSAVGLAVIWTAQSLLCSFDPTAKLSIPALFLPHLCSQTLVEASPFPIKSIHCWVLGLISLPFSPCQSHRYKTWQLRVGTSAPCSVWQLPTVSLKVLLSQAWISGNPQTLQMQGKEMLQGGSFPFF